MVSWYPLEMIGLKIWRGYNILGIGMVVNEIEPVTIPQNQKKKERYRENGLCNGNHIPPSCDTNDTTTSSITLLFHYLFWHELSSGIIFGWFDIDMSCTMEDIMFADEKRNTSPPTSKSSVASFCIALIRSTSSTTNVWYQRDWYSNYLYINHSVYAFRDATSPSIWRLILFSIIFKSASIRSITKIGFEDVIVSQRTLQWWNVKIGFICWSIEFDLFINEQNNKN